jgi:hypothetical protein
MDAYSTGTQPPSGPNYNHYTCCGQNDDDQASQATT